MMSIVRLALRRPYTFALTTLLILVGSAVNIDRFQYPVLLNSNQAIRAAFSRLFVIPTLYSLMCRPEPRCALEDEGCAEAKFERDNARPFEGSLPPEIIAVMQQQDNKTCPGAEARG